MKKEKLDLDSASSSTNLKYTSVSENNTTRIAQDLGRRLVAGDLIAFYGDLGTGKTFFIKSLCQQLGVSNEVTSPTFTIINEYHSKKDFLIYHFDFYRIENDSELLNLGLDDFFYNQYICLIEWADKIEKHLPESRWEVWLNFLPNKPQWREIKIVKIEKSN
jgi:tRNA threonylcarbamoyladenosine biosynthesis protein TsaE